MKRHSIKQSLVILALPGIFLLAATGLILWTSCARGGAALWTAGSLAAENRPVPMTGVAPEIPANTPALPVVDTMPPKVQTSAALAPGDGTTFFFPITNNLEAPPFITKNVIVMIGDGMGLEHVRAGGMYANGAAGSLSFEQFPLQALVGTQSITGVTDSAAASTAMATGHKVENGVLSMAIPGSGREYRTLLEYARDQQMSTALVTTATLWDATPGAFGAHADSRRSRADVVNDYLFSSRPNVLLGGGSNLLTPELTQQAGYTVVTTGADMLALDTETQEHVAGLFAESSMPYEVNGMDAAPHLSEMVRTALRILDNDPDGFFAVFEGGRIDHASHSNSTEAMLGEVAEFNNAVQAALDWAEGHGDTLIIVTADHETGGPVVTGETNSPGSIPPITWSTGSHTAADVGLWMWTDRLDSLPARIENSDLITLLTAGAFR